MSAHESSINPGGGESKATQTMQTPEELVAEITPFAETGEWRSWVDQWFSPPEGSLRPETSHRVDDMPSILRIKAYPGSMLNRLIWGSGFPEWLRQLLFVMLDNGSWQLVEAWVSHYHAWFVQTCHNKLRERSDWTPEEFMELLFTSPWGPRMTAECFIKYTKERFSGGRKVLWAKEDETVPPQTLLSQFVDEEGWKKGGSRMWLPKKWVGVILAWYHSPEENLTLPKKVTTTQHDVLHAMCEVLQVSIVAFTEKHGVYRIKLSKEIPRECEDMFAKQRALAIKPLFMFEVNTAEQDAYKLYSRDDLSRKTKARHWQVLMFCFKSYRIATEAVFDLLQCQDPLYASMAVSICKTYLAEFKAAPALYSSMHATEINVLLEYTVDGLRIQNKLEEAAEHLRVMYVRGYHKKDSLLNLACVYARLGHFPLALDQISELLILTSGDSTIDGAHGLTWGERMEALLPWFHYFLITQGASIPIGYVVNHCKKVPKGYRKITRALQHLLKNKKFVGNVEEILEETRQEMCELYTAYGYSFAPPFFREEVSNLMCLVYGELCTVHGYPMDGVLHACMAATTQSSINKHANDSMQRLSHCLGARDEAYASHNLPDAIVTALKKILCGEYEKKRMYHKYGQLKQCRDVFDVYALCNEFKWLERHSLLHKLRIMLFNSAEFLEPLCKRVDSRLAEIKSLRESNTELKAQIDRLSEELARLAPPELKRHKAVDVGIDYDEAGSAKKRSESPTMERLRENIPPDHIDWEKVAKSGVLFMEPVELSKDTKSSTLKTRRKYKKEGHDGRVSGHGKLRKHLTKREMQENQKEKSFLKRMGGDTSKHVN